MAAEQDASQRKSAAWSRAGQAMQAHNATMGFKTLRVMNAGASPPFEKMELVAKLGEGAFGTVERRKLVNPDGSVAFFAVKRLKQQDVDAKALASSPRSSEALPLTRLLKKLDSKATERHASQSAASKPVADDQDAEVLKLSEQLTHDDKMFLEEINLMRRLSHPNVIRYLGCGLIEEDGLAHIAIAQEVCDGGDVKRVIERAAASGTGKRLYSYDDALRWCTQVAKALQYLHEANPQVLHRDLKAENLLLTEKGRAGDIRVMDFGLTKLRRIADVGYEKATTETERYVMTGQTGSFCYMAPEVTKGDNYDEKVDIFSFAVIMYELFVMNLVAIINHKSGEPDEYELYARRVAAGYREKLRDTWPQALKDLITDCWAQEASDRPDARTVVQRLSELQATINDMDAKNPRGVIKAQGVRDAAGKSDSGSCCAIC